MYSKIYNSLPPQTSEKLQKMRNLLRHLLCQLMCQDVGTLFCEFCEYVATKCVCVPLNVYGKYQCFVHVAIFTTTSHFSSKSPESLPKKSTEASTEASTEEWGEQLPRHIGYGCLCVFVITHEAYTKDARSMPLSASRCKW